MAEDGKENDWHGVIARSLAFLALHGAGLREKDLATQGKFLESVGLSRRDAAALLGTSPASLTELMRQARNRRGGKSLGRAKAKK